MKTLSIIGCGKVGSVLGRLFREAGLYEIGEILNRTPESGAQAAALIGGGRPVCTVDEMGPADLFLIGASDDAIAGCAATLAHSELLRAGDIVWHVSGALPASVLAPLREQGGSVASVHPVKSFADALLSAAEFSGTWCGIEGDGPAVAELSSSFTTIGGRLFPVDPDFKTIYHAGSVIVCNYLTALIEVGLRSYRKGGVPPEVALQVMEPLVRGTLDNVFRSGTAPALTGPIIRGDAGVVTRQLAALEDWDADIALIYRALGRVALDLARRRRGDDPLLEEIAGALAAPSPGEGARWTARGSDGSGKG